MLLTQSLLSTTLSLAASISAYPAAVSTIVLPRNDHDDAMTCGQKNPTADLAVKVFCDKGCPTSMVTDDIMVPSDYSSKGLNCPQEDPTKATVFVRIVGNCAPAM
ncbi:hypothetical protein BJ546DRAFT_946815 [Cryomyces antarcticus]